MSKRILTVVSADYDDLECHYPILRLLEEGYTTHVAALDLNKVKGKYGTSIQPDLTFDQVDIQSYDALLIPGGWAPDQLRRFDQVLNFVTFMHKNNRVIGQICHAGWVCSSADIVKGKTVTSTPGIKHDLMHAGATWVDQPVVVDGTLISGRRPADLPYYVKAIIEVLNK
jgi:protease I